MSIQNNTSVRRRGASRRSSPGGCGGLIGGLVFALAGLGMLIFGLYSYFNIHQLKAKWEHTRGAVVEFEYGSDSDGDTVTMPVIEFSTLSGQTLRARPFEQRGISVGVSGYHIGDKVEVIYDPENPQDMFIDDFMHVWFIPVLMGGMGGLFGVIGAVWLLGVLLGMLRPASAQPAGINVSAAPTVEI